jgi:DNA-binding MarR family transcriptional regulator
MGNIDRKAAELMSEFRKLGDRYMQWQDSLTRARLGDLNKHDGSVIFFLGQDGACTMSELALKIRLTVSSATLIVDRLVDKELIARERSAEDRRVVRVALTQEGASLYRVVEETILGLGRAMLMALDEDEQDKLLFLYRKINATLPHKA